MRIGLLGIVEVHTADDGAVPLPGLRLRGLLARLALDGGQPVSASALVDALWGEQPPGANALQALVSRLRRTIGADRVATVHGGYRLAVDPQHVDVVAFETLVERAGRATPPQAHALLGQALALWRGPALADLSELPFTAAAAARVDETRATAVEDRARLALQLGAAVDLGGLTAQLAARPLRETTASLLGRGLHAAGRQADALAVLARTAAVLADELGVDPGPELSETRLAILRGTAPAPRVGLSSFVGRDHDVLRIGTLLAAGRLVTLIGPGGAGKTRLAREATDGRAVVAELAALTDAQQLPDTLLAAVGEPELVTHRPDRPQDTTSRLLDALDGRAVLLVLDNCEHLVDGVARLAERLLARSPQLRVLATSREPLGVPGEVLHPVDALPEDAAVQLFADRAAAVASGFTLDAGSRPLVAAVCRRLDGQPLPIELAAARLRTLTPTEILGRLDDRFRLLTAGARTALPRHQTLRAVVDWSWDLLDASERAVARRLAVFAGGATARAAERVCGPETFERLASLVDKSLVVAVPQPDAGPTRYRMLETIRAYAAERLDEAGERDAAQAAHAAVVVDLVEEAEPHMRGREQLPWLTLLRSEADEIDLALRRSDARDPAVAYRIVAGMTWAWFMRGRTAEVTHALEALAPADDRVPVETRARVEGCRALARLSVNDVDGCRRHAGAARALMAGVPPPWHPFLQLIGPLFALFGDHDPTMLRRLRASTDDRWVRVFCVMALAQVAENDGEHEEHHRLLRAAHTELVELGDRFGLGMVVLALGELEDRAGEHAAAAQAYDEAIAMARELGNEEDLPQFVCARALLEARRGDPTAAYAILDTIADQGASREAWFVAATRARIDRSAGDLTAARATLELADARMAAAHESSPVAQRIALTGVVKAQIEMDAGRADAAHAALRTAAEAAVRGRDGPVGAVVAEVAAQLACAEGDHACAAFLLGVATAQRGRLDLGSPDVVAVLAALRTTLGEDVTRALVDEGRHLPRAAGLARLVAFSEAGTSAVAG